MSQKIRDATVAFNDCLLYGPAYHRNDIVNMESAGKTSETNEHFSKNSAETTITTMGPPPKVCGYDQENNFIC